MPADSATVAAEQGALNYKIMTDVPISTSNLTVQNAAARQQRSQEATDAVHANAMNAAQQIAQNGATIAQQIMQNGAMLSQAMLGRVSRHILDLSAEQATAFSREIAADLNQKMEEFGATLSSIQQNSKIAQTTHPESGIVGTGAILQELATIQAVLQSLANKPASAT